MLGPMRPAALRAPRLSRRVPCLTTHLRRHASAAAAGFGGSAGPGSVPLHNAHVFVCAAGDAEEPQQFDGDALRQLHGAAAVHAGSSWTFGVSQCECGPGCEPGDWLVYPHYLHLRPAAPDAAPPALLDAVAALEPQERGVGEEAQWAAEGSAALEVVGSVRSRSHIFVWGAGGGPAALQERLLSAMPGAPAAEIVTLRCSAPVVGESPPDSLDGEAVGVAVFAAQSRDYATWGPGVGEWFSGLPDEALASRLASFVGTTHDSGGGPQTMNALAFVMKDAWRGRLGLGQEEAEAIYTHFAQ